MARVKLKDLDVDALLCRDLRHQWDGPQLLIHKKGRAKWLTREVSCLRCATIRIETISLSTFKVRARRYEYPDWYLLEKGVPFAQLRAASIKRQLLSPTTKEVKG